MEGREEATEARAEDKVRRPDEVVALELDMIKFLLPIPDLNYLAGNDQALANDYLRLYSQF